MTSHKHTDSGRTQPKHMGLITTRTRIHQFQSVQHSINPRMDTENRIAKRYTTSATRPTCSIQNTRPKSHALFSTTSPVVKSTQASLLRNLICPKLLSVAASSRNSGIRKHHIFQDDGSNHLKLGFRIKAFKSTQISQPVKTIPNIFATFIGLELILVFNKTYDPILVHGITLKKHHNNDNKQIANHIFFYPGFNIRGSPKKLLTSILFKKK